MVKVKRGERIARNVLAEINRVGLKVEIGDHPNGGPGIGYPDHANHTDEQRELATDIVMFAIAMPRNFNILRRLLRENDQ